MLCGHGVSGMPREGQPLPQEGLGGIGSGKEERMGD